MVLLLWQRHMIDISLIFEMQYYLQSIGMLTRFRTEVRGNFLNHNLSFLFYTPSPEIGDLFLFWAHFAGHCKD